MKILILTVLMLIPSRMMAAELLAGPMISHTTTSSAIIWVETDAPAKVTVDYWTQTGSTMTITRAAAETMTSESYPHTGTVTLNGLVQNTRVHYAIFGKWETGQSTGSPSLPHNARDAAAAN